MSDATTIPFETEKSVPFLNGFIFNDYISKAVFSRCLLVFEFIGATYFLALSTFGAKSINSTNLDLVELI